MDRDIKPGDLVINKNTGMVGIVLRFYKPTACKEQTVILVQKDLKNHSYSYGEYHAPTDEWKTFSYGTKAKCTIVDEFNDINKYCERELLNDKPKNIIEEVLLKIKNEILEDMSIPAGLSFNTARLAMGLEEVKPINKLVKDMDSGNVDFIHPILIWSDGNSSHVISDEELEEFKDVCGNNAESFSKSVSWSKVVQQSIKDVGQPSVSNIHKIPKPEQAISEKYLISFDIIENDIPVLQIYEDYQDGLKSITSINTLTGEYVKAIYELLTNKNLKGGK